MTANLEQSRSIVAVCGARLRKIWVSMLSIILVATVASPGQAQGLPEWIVGFLAKQFIESAEFECVQIAVTTSCTDVANCHHARRAFREARNEGDIRPIYRNLRLSSQRCSCLTGILDFYGEPYDILYAARPSSEWAC